jgi:hypothetical protein
MKYLAVLLLYGLIALVVAAVQKYSFENRYKK